jgi:phosphatidyl-myo-inositol dimannoside synthase
MRVLIVTPEFPPQFGGIGTHCYEMAKHWSEQAEVTVLAPAVNGSRVRLEMPFEVVELQAAPNRALRLWGTIRAIRRLLRANQFDAVYMGHWRTDGVAFRLATVIGTAAPRYVQAIHGSEVLCLLGTRAGAPARRAFRWTVAAADRLVALGSYQLEPLEQLGIQPERVFLSPEGVDISAFRGADADALADRLRRRHGLERKRVLLTVARLDEYKGHDMVICALPHILARVPDTLYLIVGSGGHEPALRGLVDQMGLTECVRFIGRVSEEDLAGYYHLCDVFIMATRRIGCETEGFGIVFLEAAACGKPAVGGRTGGIRDAVLDGITGLLVDPGSPSEIAEAVVTLLRNENLARGLGEAGRRRVTDELQYRDIAANILAVCLGNPSAVEVRSSPC